MGDDSKTGKSKNNTRSKILYVIRSFRLNKSGQESVINVVGVLALIALAVIFTVIVLPHLIKNMFELTSLSSAEVVARDIAGLVTISAAAPNRITLKYRMPAGYEYDVDIGGRFVKVKLEKIRYKMRGEAQAKTSIDNIEYHGDDINYIEIEKMFVAGQSVYSVQGNYYPPGEAPGESDGAPFQPPYQVPLSPEPGPSTPPEQQTKYVTEISLTTMNSHSSPYLDVDLSATFTHSDSGKQITVNGFWDGGNNWKIRFAPTIAGVWTYTTTSNDNQLSGNTGSFEYVAPTDAEKTANPNYRGFLKVSSNGRYLTYADGTPFFWMGGTFWAGNSEKMPYATDFKTYVDNRKSKKFSAIQIYLGHPTQDGGNENGPLFTSNYDKINPANFQSLDLRLKYILDKGMVPVIFMVWGEDVRDMSLNDLKNYYEYLIARYQAYNIIWCISGEYHYVLDVESDVSKVRNIGNYVHNTDVIGHLTTAHPGPGWYGETTTSDFLGETWLDVHMEQTWGDNERSLVKNDYSKNDGPFVMGEAGYEGMGHDRDRVRKDAWTVYMSGGAGHSYGANYVSLSKDWGEEWVDAINWPGSTDMKHVVTFFSGTEWWKMQPSDGLVNNGYCLAEKGRQYVVYLPSGGSVEVNLGDAFGTLNMKWFNPTTGSYSTQTTTSGGSKMTVSSPYGNIDAALYIYK